MTLEVVDFAKRYGGLVAVDAVSLTAAPGEITSLIGPNGAGKTTLLNLISGVVAADSGECRLFGRSVARMTPHELAAAGLGRTYQSPQLFDDMSVLETVMVGAHLLGAQGFVSAMFWPAGKRRDEGRLEFVARAAIARVGLPANVMHRPASELAYGLQRRVEIARALAMNPRVLLLDEPAAGFNASESRELGRLLRSLSQDGLIVFLVEHDMNLVMDISHKIVVMNFGRKIAEGAPREVQSDQNVIDAYLGVKSDDAAHA
jgi:branched-chain amino acid transport system ATP-binding protein